MIIFILNNFQHLAESICGLICACAIFRLAAPGYGLRSLADIGALFLFSFVLAKLATQLGGIVSEQYGMWAYMRYTAGVALIIWTELWYVKMMLHQK